MDLSAGALVTSFLVSTVGLGLFLYGKKATRVPQLVAGIAMMAYPYFVGSVALSWALFGGLIAAVWLAVRAGI
jgi:hypothetical protein